MLTVNFFHYVDMQVIHANTRNRCEYVDKQLINVEIRAANMHLTLHIDIKK